MPVPRHTEPEALDRQRDVVEAKVSKKDLHEAALEKAAKKASEAAKKAAKEAAKEIEKEIDANIMII